MQITSLRGRWAARAAFVLAVAVTPALCAAGTASAGAPEPVDSQAVPVATDVVVDTTPDTAGDTTPDSAPDVDVETSVATDDADAANTTDSPAPARTSAAPSVRESDIPVGSILLAVVVLLVVGFGAAATARRTGGGRPSANGGSTPRPDPGAADPAPAGHIATVSDLATLQFLVELGDALLDAGDAVGHVEATVRRVATANGIEGLGILVLPSSLVLSLHDGTSVLTEVSANTSKLLRLDQIDDVLRLVRSAEYREIDALEARRELQRIRTNPPASPPWLLMLAYVVSTAGLCLLLRGGWLEVAVASGLGLVIGGLRLATATQAATYQAFWPLVAATTASATVFAIARVFTDLAIFPTLAAPLVTFLPGVLLTIGVLELSTGQIVSGASRLAAGTMKLVLLALGIVAGAQLVGVPGGDIRSGDVGDLAALAPWFGVALFGLGTSWFHGARRHSLVWILLVLYVAYAGQIIGGLFFGSSLSAFFGAVAMTPVALLASRQPHGPTPMVTFLPAFWLLVPGALGLDGVTTLIGQGTAAGTGALATSLASMIGIALGMLLGLILAGADPANPWSASRRNTS
ncbi:MAG: threonine/serine exporter family protein [Ilumatobacteraceae bacterium]